MFSWLPLLTDISTSVYFLKPYDCCLSTTEIPATRNVSYGIYEHNSAEYLLEAPSFPLTSREGSVSLRKVLWFSLTALFLSCCPSSQEARGRRAAVATHSGCTAELEPSSTAIPECSWGGREGVGKPLQWELLLSVNVSS